MPNCQQHDACDLVCPWDGYYCHNEAHKWRWKHVRRNALDGIALRDAKSSDDMPDDPEAYYNERAERMP